MTILLISFMASNTLGILSVAPLGPCQKALPSQSQPHKMGKHTQTLRQLLTFL